MAISDVESQKNQLEEISHLVLDAGKCVNLPMLSHNHALPFAACSELLNQWLKSKKEHAEKVSRTFIVQYTDDYGNPVVCRASEEKLKSLKSDSRIKNLTEMLYEFALTTTNRSLGLKENFENVHIPIKATFNTRSIRQRFVPPVVEPKIHVKSEKVTAAGTKNISNMFSTGSNSNKDTVVKKEKVSPVKKTEVAKKESPKKQNIPAKSTDTKKNNIISFFSRNKAKPSPSTSKSEEVPIKTEEVIEKKSPETSNKRHSKLIDTDDEEDEFVPGTPQETSKGRHASKKFKSNDTKAEKAKPKLKPLSKNSRVAVIADSSEESEDEEIRDLKMREKGIEINVSDVEDEEMKSPQKNETQVQVTKSQAPEEKKPRKGRRTVTKTKMDEEGYLVTMKEIEEYDLPDEEPEPVEKKPKTETVTPPNNSKPNKTKQQNIMSFFTKK
uniref:CSON009763 protein n=1 Tax=Culicoides sonorensis TaxID=179676 RepID=A0A336M0W1_CULSO